MIDDPELRLLHAIVLGSERSARWAWEQWRSEYDLDDVSGMAFELLPAVYRALLDHGIDTAEVSRLKGVARHTWMQSEVTDAAGAALAAVLAEEGIESIRVGGVARSRFYPDPTARSRRDSGLLVEPGAASSVVEVAAGHGWSWFGPAVDSFDNRRLVALHNANDTVVDIHWRVTGPAFDEASDDGVRGRASDGLLSPADELLHVLLHGHDDADRRASPWIIDAVNLVRATADLDWVTFREEVARRRLALPVIDAVAAIDDLRRGELPANVSADLRSLPATRSERLEHAGRRRAPATQHWFRYTRSVRIEGQRAGPVGFVRWLDRQYGLRQPGEVVRRARRRRS